MWRAKPPPIPLTPAEKKVLETINEMVNAGYRYAVRTRKLFLPQNTNIVADYMTTRTLSD